MNEFPEKNWKKGGLDKLLRRLRDTQMVERKKGSGRPKTTRTAENIATVNELVQSQEANHTLIVPCAKSLQKQEFLGHLFHV